MSRPGRWRSPYLTTRDLVLVAVISAVGGALSSYVGYLGNLLNRVLGVPFGAGQFMAGLHVLWFLVILGITGKPGAGTLAGILKGVGELVMGSTHGAVIVLVSAVQGIIADAVWLLLWRLGMPLLTYTVAGALAAASNVLVFQILFVSGATFGYIALMCFFAAISGVLFGGYLAFGIVESLRGTRLGGRAAATGGRPAGRRGKARLVVVLLLCVALGAGALYYYGFVFQPPWAGPGCRVEGLVDQPYVFRYSPGDDRVTTINAELRGKVTYVAPRDYTGVPVGELLSVAGPRSGAGRVRVIAADGYEVEFALAEMLGRNDILLGPEGDALRLVAPGYEGGYWVRQVSRLVVE